MNSDDRAFERRALLGGAAALALAASGLGRPLRTAAVTVDTPRTAPHRLVERGINYDVGTAYTAGEIARTVWRTDYVRREIAAIRDELGCTSVLIVGSDVDRLLETAAIAAENDLGVWLEPRPFDQAADAAIDLFTTIADAAEALHADHENVVMSLGVEHTLFLSGLVPGATWDERGSNLPHTDPAVYNGRLNTFLADAVTAVRPVFGGKLTYSSGSWEDVDWSDFDLVGVNLYRDRDNAATYSEQVRSYHRHGKPVVITEFGCCSYIGADDLGGTGYTIIDLTTGRLQGNPIRDESVQATYIDELLDVFEAEGVHGAFVWTFIEPDSPYSADPVYDYDMASFAVVRCNGEGSPDHYATTGRWKPKEAFRTITQRYETDD